MSGSTGAVAEVPSRERDGRGVVRALRSVAWPDLARLAELDAELFADDAWSEATWWAELAGRPRRDYVVAVDASGEVLGYAGVDLAGEVADVMTVAVVPAARGTGLGDRLVGWLVARAEESGAEALLLEVRADNAPARRLYARHGFAELSVRRRYYQPGDVDAVIMRKLLSQKGTDRG
ncbi:ribosomal protein S18-alanine N-acetyltransferase [Lapillicoccus jejuensis]|uniref:Ribosomal-protein-alanine N-acetyltransferase n=1 Tax=Lapillicoccus jejuensis TaxID=402171 RepID=A0A542E1V3_9MICO|nr:ribosomal-protein-alanine N-acetyltransferase [Lapillicoccus jejuensis]